MLIRNYQSSDHQQVIDLQKRALVAIDAWKGDGPWDDDLQNIEEIYDQNVGFFLVGVVENQVVAMGALYIENQKVAEIRRFRVDPHWQGRGFAREIYLALEALANTHKISRLYLDTGEVQTAARHFYEKMGFVEYGRETIWEMPCICYEKYLNSKA